VNIRAFLHKGLKKLYLEDNAKGLPPDAVEKLQAMLTFLEDMQGPGGVEGVSSLESPPTYWRPEGCLESPRYAQLAINFPDQGWRNMGGGF
jgi:hypothetical protein